MHDQLELLSHCQDVGKRMKLQTVKNVAVRLMSKRQSTAFKFQSQLDLKSLLGAEMCFQEQFLFESDQGYDVNDVKQSIGDDNYYGSA